MTKKEKLWVRCHFSLKQLRCCLSWLFLFYKFFGRSEHNNIRAKISESRLSENRSGNPKQSAEKWNKDHNNNCYIAENFAPTTRVFIGYFEVAWHLRIKLFPAKSLWAGNSAKSMTSEGNNALLTANVDQRPPLLLSLHVFLFVLYNKSLNECSLGKQLISFPSNFNASLGCASGKHWDSRQTELTVSLGTSH